MSGQCTNNDIMDKNSKDFQFSPLPHTPSPAHGDRPATIVTTRAGETLRIFSTSNGFKAILQNRQDPGLATKLLPVYFGPGYSFSSISQSHNIHNKGYVKDVQLLFAKDKKSSSKQIVYIGKVGLLGGGGSQTKSHSCEGFPIYKCGACSFQCPNGKCIECCIHKTHTCEETQKKTQKRKNASKIKEVLIEEEIHGQMSYDENYDFTYNDIVSNLNTEENSKQYYVQKPSNILSDEEWKENHDRDVKHSQTAHQKSFPLISRTTKRWQKFIDLLNSEVHSVHPNNNSKYISANLPPWLCVILNLVLSFAIVLLKYIFKISKTTMWTAYNCKLYFNQRNLVYQLKETYLLQEHVRYERTDCMSIEKFKSVWKDVCDTYENKDRINLLKLLLQERMFKNMSLVDICSGLKCILQTDKLEISDICESRRLCFHNLKREWIESNIGRFCNAEEDSLLKPQIQIITELLTENDWSTEVCEIFLKCIAKESTDDLSELFTLLKTVHVPEAVVLSILLSPTPLSTSRNVVDHWVLSLSYQILCKEVCEMNFDIEPLAPLIYNLLQASCSRDLLLNVLTKQEKTIKQHFTEFIEVLKLLTNYQVKGGICKSSLFLLQETRPQKWLQTVDKHIATNIFQGSKTYNIDELIEHICKHSTLEKHELKAHFNSVSDAFCSCTTMEKATNSYIFDSMRLKIISKWSKNEIKLWAQLVKGGKTVSLHEKIAVLKQAVKLTHEMEPRAVQILTLLVLLHPQEGKGRLVQVNTGEGKSLIVAMLSSIHAIEGKIVDVITTSTELSIREVKKQRYLFEMLSLTVSENSGDNTEKKKEHSIYGCDIVYGTASEFQADILRKEFEGVDCRMERGYGVVIVDEVDSMLYDSLSCSVRLSGPIPGMNHLEIALAAIWERVNRIQQHFVQHNDQIYYIPDDFERNEGNIILDSGDKWQDVAEPVVDKESFIIEKTMEHMKQVLRHLSDSEKDEYETHKNLLNQISEKEKEIAAASDEGKKACLKEQYENLQEKYKCSSWHNYYPVIEIPVHLHEFAVQQLPYWIKNAVYAAFAYKKDFHYTVQNNRIVPIHYNETGVLQPNLVWSDGLTQFLQIKEDLPVEPESITTNFISNIGFFQRYGSSIYGLTGTMGQKSTQEFLSTTYDVDIVVIPPHKIMHIVDNEGCNYLCKELVPIIVSTEEEWYDNIVNHALFHAKQFRAVLVICKFIEQVKKLAGRMESEYDSAKIFTYTGEKLKFNKRVICSGEIIIATNIAGRGTDIKTSPRVEEHGGMYVMVTFLPDSYRVELQNVGRTAREGKKGMAQIIVQNPIREMTTLKRLRTNREDRIDKTAIHEAEKVLIHDELFKMFCDMQCRYLPSVPNCKKIELWKTLKTDWDNCKRKHLHDKKARSKFDRAVEKAWREEQMECLGEEQFKEEGFEEFKREKWTSYVKKKEKMLFTDFCDTRPYFVSADLISCLRDGKSFEANISELAIEHEWGIYERNGLTERWGLWYKSHHFETQDVSSASAISLFNKFEETVAMDAAKNKLIKNPFYYVLKGNDRLQNAQKTKATRFQKSYRNGELESAISCYDLAISLDPAFSLHAHYNKACALLSFRDNKGQKQKDAFEELQLASNIINHSFHPYLVAFHTLVAQTGVYKLAAQHIKHQYDILSQQLNYIERTCKFINPEICNSDVGVNLLSVQKAMEVSGENYSKAVIETATNGLTHFFTVQAVSSFSWSNIALFAMLGLTELVVGGLLCCFGAVANGGMLLAAGIHDIMTVVQMSLEEVFSWSRLGILKAINLAANLMTAGWKRVKKLTESLAENPLKRAVTQVKNAVVNIVHGESYQKCRSEVEKKRVIASYLEGRHEEMVDVVANCLTSKLAKNHLIVSALSADNKNESKDWERLFVSEGMKILQEESQHFLEQHLQEILLNLSNLLINNEEADDETNKFMEELEKYINTFSEKFVQKVNKQEKLIERAVKQEGFIFVRAGKSIWKNLKGTVELLIDIKDADVVNDLEHNNRTMSDENTFVSSNCDEEVKTHAVSVNESGYYTSKPNPVSHNIADTSYSSPTSVEDLTAVFTKRICEAVFLNIKYKSHDSGNENLAHEIFNEINEANKKLRENLKFKKTVSGNFASGHGNDSRDLIKLEPVHDGENVKLSNVLEGAMKSLHCNSDFPPNTATLEVLTYALDVPILIFKCETGKLLLVKGNLESAAPIMLKVTAPSLENPSGAWAPLLQNTIKANEQNFLDALWCQLSMREEGKLHNELALIKMMMEWVHDNTEAATELLEKQGIINELLT